MESEDEEDLNLAEQVTAPGDAAAGTLAGSESISPSSLRHCTTSSSTVRRVVNVATRIVTLRCSPPICWIAAT